jgi:hypothetical protein
VSTTSTSAAPTAVATPEEVQTFRAEQEKEWGQYVAVAPISFNGAPAYNVGDAVPASNVERYKYAEQGLVAKIGSKNANETIRAIANAASAEPAESASAPLSLNVSVPEGK